MNRRGLFKGLAGLAAAGAVARIAPVEAGEVSAVDDAFRRVMWDMSQHYMTFGPYLYCVDERGVTLVNAQQRRS